MNIKDDDESFEVNDPANCSEEGKLICQKMRRKSMSFCIYSELLGLLILIWSAPADWLGWLTFFLAGICKTIKLQVRRIGWIPLSFQGKTGCLPELNNIFFVFHDTICSGWRLGTWEQARVLIRLFQEFNIRRCKDWGMVIICNWSWWPKVL